MKLTIEKDYDAMSRHAAAHVIEIVKAKPNAVFCIAAGDTPKLMCKYISEAANEDKIDFSRAIFVSLDEWVGIPPENEGSCQYFLRNNIFGPLNIPDHNTHLFDSLAEDPQDECRKMEDFIDAHGGIDLIVVGVGRNGHIGFNEPGIPFDLYSHVVELHEITQTVGQKYFREQTMLTHGITIGLQHLLEARKAILIANGKAKAEAMKKAIEGDVSPEMPASVMRKHGNGEIILDEEAASLLTRSHEVQ